MALKHALPGEVVNLRPLGERLGDAQTSAIVRTATFEAVRIILPADARIPAHKVPGRIMLHCIEGSIELGLDEGPIFMSAGEWLYLEGEASHSLRGLEDASLLLTILFESEKTKA